MEPEIVYTWAGPRDDDGQPVAGDAYLPGVPARDLSVDDLAGLPQHVLESIAVSTLYERVPLAGEE